MNPTSIPTLLTYPDGTPVEIVEGRIFAVYEYKNLTGGQYGPTTVQAGVLTDGAGNKIRISAWGHPDLTKLKDMEIVIHSTKGKGGKLGGVKIKHSTFTPKGSDAPEKRVELEIGRLGCFQRPDVFRQLSGQPAQASTTQSGSGLTEASGRSGLQPIAGAKVGMAINCVAAALLDAGFSLSDPNYYIHLADHCSRFIRLSNWLEEGNLVPDVSKGLEGSNMTKGTPGTPSQSSEATKSLNVAKTVKPENEEDQAF